MYWIYVETSLTLLGFLLMSFLCVLPLFFVYILSKHFKRYFKTRSWRFVVGLIFAFLSIIPLTIDFFANPSSLVIVSKEPLLELHLVGEILLLFAFLCFYSLISDIRKIISGEKRENLFAYMALFGSFLFAFYYSFSLQVYDVYTAVVMSSNFIIVIAIISLGFMMLIDVAEIYKRLHNRYYVLVIGAAVLILWQVFYQFHGFMIKILDLNLSYQYSETLNIMRIVLIFSTVILATLPAVPLLKNWKKRVRVVKEADDVTLMLFLSEMTKLIGSSAITIFKNALNEYNGEHESPISFSPETGLSDKSTSKEVLNFGLDYFEKYIGPVSGRIYKEISSKKS